MSLTFFPLHRQTCRICCERMKAQHTQVMIIRSVKLRKILRFFQLLLSKLEKGVRAGIILRTIWKNFVLQETLMFLSFSTKTFRVCPSFWVKKSHFGWKDQKTASAPVSSCLISRADVILLYYPRIYWAFDFVNVGIPFPSCPPILLRCVICKTDKFVRWGHVEITTLESTSSKPLQIAHRLPHVVSTSLHVIAPFLHGLRPSSHGPSLQSLPCLLWIDFNAYRYSQLCVRFSSSSNRGGEIGLFL